MRIKPELQNSIYHQNQYNLAISEIIEDGGLCQVCANPHDGFHFGIQSCRACAAFYRRSVVEQRVYSCKNGLNACQLHCVEQRKICRSCRLTKCINVGMQSSGVQMHRDPLRNVEKRSQNDTNVDSPQSSTSNNDYNICLSNYNSISPTDWQSSPSTSSISNSTALAIIDNPRGKRPMLEHLTNGYLNWDVAQKYVHALMFPNESRKLRVPTISEFREMDSACVNLVVTMLDDYFPSFNIVPAELKELIMPRFVKLFRILERSVKTERIFGRNATSGFTYIQYGQYINIGHLEEFFKGENKVKEAAKATKDVYVKCTPFMEKLQHLEVRDTEIAGLSAVILWNLLLEVTNDESFETLRDRAFNELHEDVIEEYGEEAPTRQMELAYLLSSVNAVMHEVNIYHTTSRLFNLYKLTEWDYRL